MFNLNAIVHRHAHTLYVVIGTAYLCYLLIRALMVPMTIDEGYSIMTYVDKPVWQIVTYDYDGISANNHILNTLSIKFFSAIFGMNLLTARLAVLLGALLYVGVGIAFARRLFSDAWSGLALLLLWLGNPYLAEFFAIGRGYGLSIGLMAFSIWHGWRWLQQPESALRPLLGALAGAWLAVAANFTLLSYYLFLSGVILWQLLGQREKRRQGAIAWGVTTALLALFLYSPLRALIRAEEFEKFGVNGFYKDMLYTFVRCGFRGAEYFGSETYPRFAWGVVAVGALVLLAGLIRMIRQRGRWDATLWLIALLPGVMAVNAVMTLSTQATWLPGRTNVFFYPLLVLSICGAVANFPATLRLPRQLLLQALALPVAFHFFYCANLSESFEWWFDRDTFKVLDYVKNVHIEEKRSDRIRFNCYWVYNPSFTFHLKNGPGNYKAHIEPDISWIPMPKPEDNYEFFFADRERKDALLNDYEVVWVVQPGDRYLLRKKASNKLTN